MPEGAELAWKVHERLASPAVQGLGLQQIALQAISLELTQGEALKLLDELDAIQEGLADVRKTLAKREKK